MTVETTATFHRYKPGAAMLPEALPGVSFETSADLQVFLWPLGVAEAAVLQSEGTHYTIGGNGENAAAAITALVEYAAEDELLILRSSGRFQRARLTADARLPVREIERTLDRNVRAGQEIDREVNRAARVPYGEIGLAIPSVAVRKGKYWRYDPVTGAAALDDPDNFAAPARASAALAESLSGPTYASVAAGLADTGSGAFFAVDNGDGTVTIYLNDGGEAVEQRTLATTEALASPTGAERVNYKTMTMAAYIGRAAVTPEEYGCDIEDPNCSAFMQDAFSAAADEGRELTGNRRTYNWKTAEIPSGSRIRDINASVPDDNQDNAPFYINGQITSKSNITLTDINIYGNRIGRSAMVSSGGDGQSAGVKGFGRVSNVTMERVSADFCATEGFFFWTGVVIPEGPDDLMFDGLKFIDCNARWSGRHGLSLTSHRNTLLRGGQWRHNGKDLPGFPSGIETNGGNGRRFNGGLFGRPFTHEGFFLGEHYENWTIEHPDCRDNRGGPLLFNCMFPTKRSAKNLVVTGGLYDDPYNGVGSGAFILYAVNVPNDDGNGSRTVYTGTDAFDGVSFNGSHFDFNYINFSNARNIRLIGCENPDPANANDSIIYTNCTDVLVSDIRSKKSQFGRPSPIVNTSIGLPAGWTASTPDLSSPSDIVGGYSFFYEVDLTPNGAGLQRIPLIFTAGYRLRPSFSTIRRTAGFFTPLLGSVEPGSEGSNQLDVWIDATNTDPLKVRVGFEARPL